MVLDRQTAIEEIIKGVFGLDEVQVVHVAGTIHGMATANRLLATYKKSHTGQNLSKEKNE
ncbi:MAG: hypothetical protein KHY44_06150 [Clostridiales bacterium]|nr:hypothetical protein [Clostridiales bacterium]